MGWGSCQWAGKWARRLLVSWLLVLMGRVTGRTNGLVTGQRGCWLTRAVETNNQLGSSSEYGQPLQP